MINPSRRRRRTGRATSWPHLAIWLILAMLGFGPLNGQCQDTTVASSVTFQTTDLVYLDQGRSAGVAVGDTVKIFRNDSLIAELIVEHVASQSASCRVLTEVVPVELGDAATIAIRPADETEPPERDIGSPGSRRSLPKRQPHQPINPPPLARVNGSVRLSAHSWNAEGDARDYTQSLMTANITAQQIAGRNLTLRIRSNGRRNDRGSGSSVADEWTSNINLFSLEYQSENGAWGVEAGRFLPGRLGLAGYVDGALVQVHPSSQVAVGVFGGLTPQWQFASAQSDLHKIGAYTRIDYGSVRARQVDVSLGMLGEYSGSDISREVVFSRGRVVLDRRWSLSHSVEVDVNRGWRADREGSSFTLSTAYANLRWQTAPSLSLHAGYNHHRRTLEDASRTTPDSLFDTRARQRWRLGAQWSLPSQIWVGGEYGFRHLSGGADRGSSYSLNARKRGLWNNGASIDVRAMIFTDGDAEGTDMSARIGQFIGRGHYLSIGAGRYEYRDEVASNTRDNRWGEIGLRLNLGLGFTGDARLRQSLGDDLDGQRIQLGVTYRL